MVRESLDLVIQEDGRIATEVRTPYSGPLWEFFRSHNITSGAVHEDCPLTPLYDQANQAHFRMTRRGDRYVFGLTTVQKVFSQSSVTSQLPTREEVIAKASSYGLEPVNEDSKDELRFISFQTNGNSKSNWSYDFTNNRIKVIKAPGFPEQKEQQL